MTTGTIKKVVADRGFGFIAAEDDEGILLPSRRPRFLARLRPPHRRREGRVRDRGEPQGPARDQVRPPSDRPVHRRAARHRPARGGPAPPCRPRSRRSPRSARRREEPAIVRTAFVSTYPPRRCGIATFTRDLAAATGNREIVALHPPESGRAYPTRGPPPDPPRRAGRLPPDGRAPSSDCVDVVSIQHEYGIWGGEDGDHVLDFVRALGRPVGRHAPHGPAAPDAGPARPSSPSSSAATDATVVMSRSAADLLTSAYGVDPEPVCTSSRTACPNCRSSMPRRSSRASASRVATCILSFGLLGPGKGYELAIDALPAVVAAHPTALLRHRRRDPPGPPSQRGRGLPRARWSRRSPSSGSSDHVQFVDRFVGRVELTPLARGGRRLRDALSQPRPDRVRHPVVRDGRRPGDRLDAVRVCHASSSPTVAACSSPPASPAAWRPRSTTLLADPDPARSHRRPGVRVQPRMVWSAVGAAYRELFARVGRWPEDAPMPSRSALRAAVGA